jgi:hypothetical protein
MTYLVPRLARAGVAILIALAGGASLAAVVPAVQATAGQAPDESAAGKLRAIYAEVRGRLERNDFGRPIHLDSRENGRELKGDVFALVDHPFPTVESGLQDAASWCEILILPFNTKHCTSEEGRALSLFVGKKKDTPIEDTHRLDFKYQAVARAKDYMRTLLTADAGPLGTRDYRIALEAIPIDKSRTFVHLSYAYTYGTLSSLAMQAYLATSGASKVGFTVDGTDGEGRPSFVKGMRGVMERNTMRYFLAIDAFLDSLTAPVVARLQKRLDIWFSASERYPRQLHEMDRGEYVAMKQREMRRLQAAKVLAGG